VTHSMRLSSSFAQTLLAIRFILGVVAFEEDRLRIVFVRQDVRGYTVKEPPIVRDHNGSAREVQQRFLQ